jgi:hypothetical protein
MVGHWINNGVDDWLMKDQTNSDLVDNQSDVLPGYIRDGQARAPHKIAILGTCPSRVSAPVNDPSWEIWTIGPGGKDANRWERLYEVHDQDTWPAGFTEYLDELKAVLPPRQIVVKEAMPDWPAAVVYPKEERTAKYGAMWFSSQISYALADAIELNPTDIGIYGIDLEAGEEYQVQFTGAKFFMQLAQLAGINLHLPRGCNLMRDPSPYPDGWETHLAATLDSKLEYLGGMHAQKVAQHGALAAEINLIQGEISMAQFLRNMYVLHGINPLQSGPPKRDMTDSMKLDAILTTMREKGLM